MGSNGQQWDSNPRPSAWQMPAMFAPVRARSLKPSDYTGSVRANATERERTTNLAILATPSGARMTSVVGSWPSAIRFVRLWVDPRDGAVERVRDSHRAGAERDPRWPVADGHLYDRTAGGIDASQTRRRPASPIETSATSRFVSSPISATAFARAELRPGLPPVTSMTSTTSAAPRRSAAPIAIRIPLRRLGRRRGGAGRRGVELRVVPQDRTLELL